MPFTVTLQEVTPYRLRYLLVQQGDEAETELFVIPNAAGVTPDLRTDAALFNGSPIHQLVSRICTVSNAEAQRILIGTGSITNLALENPRAHIYLTPRVTAAVAANWAYTVQEGSLAGSAPSANHAVIVVEGSGLEAQACYVDLDFEHTFDR